MKSMRVMHRLHGQWLTLPLAVGCAGMFLIPLLGISPVREYDVRMSGSQLVARGEGVGIILVQLALVLGAIVAHRLWSPDVHSGHVYAASLPMSRRAFVVRRAVSGLVWLMVPAASATLAIALLPHQLSFPPGIRAYALWTGLRLYLAAALAFSLWFTMRIAVGARGRRWIGAALIALVGVAWLQSALGQSTGWFGRSMAFTFLSPGSPFHVIFSAWRIIDI